MGKVLYEIKSGNTVKGSDCVINSLQFYEHVVVATNSYYDENSQVTDYKTTVIPRFKIVDVTIEKQTHNNKLRHKNSGISVGKNPMWIIARGYKTCCFCNEESLEDSQQQTYEPPPTSNYYIALEVRRSNSGANTGGDTSSHAVIHRETETTVFACQKVPNQLFIIQYVYGVLKNIDDCAQSAHLMSHLASATTAGASTTFDYRGFSGDGVVAATLERY